MTPLAQYTPRHLQLTEAGGVITLTLNRPERKNPLTFESYAELSAIFRAGAGDDAAKVFIDRKSVV